MLPRKDYCRSLALAAKGQQETLEVDRSQSVEDRQDAQLASQPLRDWSPRMAVQDPPSPRPDRWATRRMAGRPATEPIDDLARCPRKLITPIQLALYAGVTRRTIYHHIEKGALKVRHVGGVIRIHITEARKYVGDTA